MIERNCNHDGENEEVTRLHAGVDCDVEMVLYRVIYTHGYYGCQNQFTFHRPVLLLGSAQARGTVLRE